MTAYVGNESNADVYFDDVQVTLGQGLQVQETEYDPAGLVAPSPGIRGLNQYKFNGKEFQADLGLDWNHQDWRFLNPQLLRWHAVDPEVENGQESWTPYSFGYDNAVRYADADGREPGDGDGFWSRAADFATGVRDAINSNNTTISLPTGSYSLVHATAIPSPSYSNGQTLGNLLSFGQGVAQMVVGGGAAAEGAAGGTLTAPTGVGAVAGYAVAAVGVGVAAHGYSTASNAARNLLGDNNGRVNASTKGEAKGSLSETKKALTEAKEKLGLKPNESLPKGEQSKSGSPQRGTSKKGYRLDPSHPNAKLGSSEEYPHVNYWDYTKGKRDKGGVSEAVPIKN